MKKTLVFAASLMATASCLQAGTSYEPSSAPAKAPVMQPPAPAAELPYYFNVRGGALWLNSIDGVEFDTGWGVTGAFGFNLGGGFSIEAEGGYYTADIDSFEGESSFFGEDLDGDVYGVPIMANLKYSLPVTNYLNLYFGVGAGALHSEYDVSLGPVSVGRDQWDFAFQGLAGISIPMSEVFSFDVGYRFLGTGFQSDDVRGNIVEAGITFKF